VLQVSHHPKQVDAEIRCQECQSQESRLRRMGRAILNLHCLQTVLGSRFRQSRLMGQELGFVHPESA
jgi:hypothetical protein